MNGTDRCIPWYYPPVDPEVRVCDPFEARDFNKEIERMRADKCQVITRSGKQTVLELLKYRAGRPIIRNVLKNLGRSPGLLGQ